MDVTVACKGFGDLALIFKVTSELNRSNLSMCDICFL